MATQYNYDTTNTDGPLKLERGVIASVKDAYGTEVQLATGCLWITQEHDRRDIVLQAGERLRLDRHGKAVISARRDSALILITPVSAKTPMQIQQISILEEDSSFPLPRHRISVSWQRLNRWLQVSIGRRTVFLVRPRGAEV